MKKIRLTAIIILLSALTAGNALQYLFNKQKPEQPPIVPIVFSNANSRDTYFTVHNIAEAHKISKGKGIKVGVIDWNFAYEEHKELYADLVDFTGERNNYTDGHGYWMAAALKEIAPECEVYGLGVGLGLDSVWNESDFADVMIEAVNWSIDNGLDVLSLSLQRISDDNRARVDEAVDKAISHGIVTAFIHYDNPGNILPIGLLEFDTDFFPYTRKPDINVLHYDYNVLLAEQYLAYLESGPPATYADVRDGGYIPFLSFSSMAPVTAGFVAVLKSINNTLPAAEYKKILIETSYSMHFNGGVADFEDSDIERVVDIGNAVKYLQENYNQ